MEKIAYIIGQIEVKDYKVYLVQYGKPFMKVLEKYQGELLAATKNGKTLEGEPFGNWTVLLKFPTKDLAYNFITSEEYAPLMALRINELTTGSKAMLFPGEVPDLSKV